MVNIGRSGLWRPAVQPSLERLAEAFGDRGASDHSVFVEVAGVRLLLTPLEQQLTCTISEGGRSEFPRRHMLVRDSLGLKVKIQCALARLDEADPDGGEDLIEELAADVDLGCQLMHEITQEMKELTAAGQMDEAKEFSQYRKQLLQLVGRAERRAQQAAAAEPAGDSAAVAAAQAPERPGHGPAPEARPGQAGVWLKRLAWAAVPALLALLAWLLARGWIDSLQW